MFRLMERLVYQCFLEKILNQNRKVDLHQEEVVLDHHQGNLDHDRLLEIDQDHLVGVVIVQVDLVEEEAPQVVDHLADLVLLDPRVEQVVDLDLVLVMTVNPGFGGQSFIENTYAKVKKLKELITRKNASTIIEIDGGVTNKNAKQLVEAGADVLVAGSFVFKAENPTTTIADLKILTAF